MGNHTFGKMGCQEGQGAPAPWNRIAYGVLGGLGGQDPKRCRPYQNPVSGPFRGLRIPVRPQPLRCLRQCHQQGRFRRGQTAGSFAEIAQAGRHNTFDVAAIGGQGQVERQDLILVEFALQPDSAHHLQQFCGQCPGARVQQTHGLHGDGGCPGHDPSGRQTLSDSAQQGHRIDTRMIREPLVFDRQQEPEKQRVDRLRIGGQPVPVVGGEEDPQRPVVPVGNRHRQIRRLEPRGIKRRGQAEDCGKPEC